MAGPFSFDPTGMPRGYVRFVGTTTAFGAVLFGGLAVWGFIQTGRTLSAHGQDIMAVLQLMKAAFLFVITGVSGAMAAVLAWVTLRCWLSSA